MDSENYCVREVRRVEMADKKYYFEQIVEYKNLDGLEIRDLGVSGRKNVKEVTLDRFLKKAEKGEIPANSFLVVESMSWLTRDEPCEKIGPIRRLGVFKYTIAFT